MNRSFAISLTYLLHPAVFPLLGVLAVMQFTPYFLPANAVILTLTLVFTGTYALPLAMSFLMYRMKIINSLEMKKATDRRIPYMIGGLCYYLVSRLIAGIGLAEEASLFLLASAAVIILHLLCLSFFKPSAHMAGIGGFTALLLAISLKYQVNLLPLIAFAFLLTGFLASARLYLRAHTPFELVFGYFSSVLVVFFTIYYS